MVFWSKVCFGNHRQHCFPTSLHSWSENSIGTCHKWIPNFAQLLLLVSSSIWNHRQNNWGIPFFFFAFSTQITIWKTVADSYVKCTQTAIATINDCLFRHPFGNVRPHQIRYLFSPFLPQIHRFLCLSLIRVVHFVLQFHCLRLSEDERFL